MEFISSMVGHLAWPTVVIVMYVLLRDQVATLFKKVSHLRFKDLELDFEKVKQQAEAISDARGLVRSDDEAPVRSEDASVFSSLEDQIFEAVERAPAASILLAWSAVETALASAAARLTDSPENASYRSPLHNMEMLEQRGELSRRHAILLQEMRILRNKVMHEGQLSHAISETHALDYAKAAVSMISVLNGLNRVYETFVAVNGAWSQLPPYFVAAPRSNANGWNASKIALSNTGLVATVGPWHRVGETEAVNYGIAVEMPTERGVRSIDELRISLDLVEPAALTKTAEEVVSFDEVTREITFDLGLSVFKYRIL